MANSPILHHILYHILYGLFLFLGLIWADTGAPLRLPSFLRRGREHKTTVTGTGTQVSEEGQAETKAVKLDPSRAQDPIRVIHFSKRYGSIQEVEDVSSRFSPCLDLMARVRPQRLTPSREAHA